MALSVTQADGPLRIAGAVVIGTINASGAFEQYIGPSYKAPCRCATTVSITIATALNAGDAIDGVTLVAGDRVLVKNQAAPAQNGIYVAGVTPARSTDFDEWSEIPGAVVGVTEGSTQADTAWLCTSDAGGTLNTTAINFSAFGTSTNLASPGPIGGTTPDAGTFTTVTANTSLSIGGGPAISRFRTYSGSLGSNSISAGAYGAISISAGGTVTTDFAFASLDAVLADGLVIAAVVCAADEVKILIYNSDLITPHSPSSQGVYITVLRA